MLKVIAAEEGSTVQALLAEGINTVFAKRGRPGIAGAAPVAVVQVQSMNTEIMRHTLHDVITRLDKVGENLNTLIEVLGRHSISSLVFGDSQ